MCYLQNARCRCVQIAQQRRELMQKLHNMRVLSMDSEELATSNTIHEGKRTAPSQSEGCSAPSLSGADMRL